MFGMDTRIHGPVFDGRADRAVHAFCEDVEQQIAHQGENDVRSNLHHVLRHPTGRYESRITTERARGDWAVTDQGIVYGPWLEGVGSRNRTTRFKGYFTFRRTAQQLRAKATPIAERVLRKYLGRMG